MTDQNAARSASPSALTSKQAPNEPKASPVPWRERPLLPLLEGAQITGVSIGTLYGMANKGQIKLKRFGGRTLIETATLIAALDAAEDWSSSPRTEKAVAARAERTRAAWGD